MPIINGSLYCSPHFLGAIPRFEDYFFARRIKFVTHD